MVLGHERVLRSEFRQLGQHVVDEVWHGGKLSVRGDGDALLDVSTAVLLGQRGAVEAQGAAGRVLRVSQQQRF
jgi:hypothetical protein